MPVAVHDSEPRFLFFWSNKVASRSLLAGLGEAFQGLETYAQSAFRPPIDDGDWPRFLLVRSPWARAVSCYRNKCRDAPRGLERHGGRLEPCQRHLLRAMGESPFQAERGARLLSELSFPSFVALLPRVRDGNSHFRPQVHVLRDTAPATSRARWLLRSARAALHVVRTHWSLPGLLRTGRDRRWTRAALNAARRDPVRWIRLEELPEGWHEVEEALGRSIPLPWHTRTSEENDWESFYDIDTAGAVGEIYRADVEAFDYEPPALRPPQKL